MIEVIKQGSKNQVECDNCGALLKYCVDDIEKEEIIFGQRGEAYTKKSIKCPSCHFKIALDKS